MASYHLVIDGFSNPKRFIEDWSKAYKYDLESKYTDNIEKGFDSNQNLLELMAWKNGTGDRISGNKLKLVNEFLVKRAVLKTIKTNFSFSEFETHFEPAKRAAIWKIFLLHIIDPINHPIFDQHVYRAFIFIKTGKIRDLSSTDHKQVYRIYKDEYLPWFNEIREKWKLEYRMIDKALFAFGQTLKKLRGLPVVIITK